MVATKKAPQIQAIYNFFQFFEKYITGHSQENEVEKYLSKSFTIYSNGEQLGKNIEDYKKRMHLFKEKYSEFKISDPIEEPILSGNQVIIHYKIDLKTKQGEKRQVQIMAMGTLGKDQKIERWIQVAGDTHQANWDKK